MKMNHIKLYENFKGNLVIQQAFDAVTQLGAQEMEEFLFALSKYFDDEKEYLTNMDAESISKDLASCAERVKNRSGN